jgi:hypothetical protein
MLTRHRDPRIVPLELWDLIVDTTPLYRMERGPGFGHHLARAVDSLIAGLAVSESHARFPAICRDIAQVVLVGGATHTVTWPSTGIPAIHHPDPEACAEHGGRSILAALGRRGLVIDLGQSRLKLAGTTRRSYPRDFTRIPPSPRPVTHEGRDALIAFVAAALREAAEDAPPHALVLALPCEISPDGALGTCSYPWSAGDPIVPEILAAAGLAHLPCVLLNDAELAAIGVAAHTQITTPTLVLTVGFGIGAALVLPGPP